MNDFNIVSNMPPMLSGQELISALSVFPEYDDSIRYQNQAVRLMALSDIHRLYIPSQMSIEIYSSLYLALMRSMQKKGTQIAIKQRYENYKAIQQQDYRGIMGGADASSIIGCSGIGKSSAISRAIDLITENKIIEIKNPYTKIIPVLNVQCPFDASPKQLLLEILRKVDEQFGSKYYSNAIKTRSVTTDMLIGTVSTIALNNLGILVVDEIQNVANSKNGKILVGVLTQLINNSGISIITVGVPESIPFFQQALQLARRSTGLIYTTMEYDSYFENFCKVLFKYQYVKQKTEITDGIMQWLYEHSSGILAVVVSLVYSAQEIAILTGKEILNLETLNEAYQQRLSMLHGYIEPSINRKKQISVSKKKSKPISVIEDNISDTGHSIAKLVSKAKTESLDIVQLLKEHMTVVEVSI